MSNKVILPLQLTIAPVKKLALINFEKNPDEHYYGLELQYIDDTAIGRGFRVLAYRHDGYVDVYDDLHLHDTVSSFDVAGKGLSDWNKVKMENTSFEIGPKGVHLSFQLMDKYDRFIDLEISEHTSRKTHPVDLLAPIGVSSEKPSYLPVFFLYDFDFVRKSHSKVKLEIGTKEMKTDSFPVPIPKDLQWRSFIRFSDNCQLIEFAKAGKSVLEEFNLAEDKTVTARGFTYYFSREHALNKIVIEDEKNPFTITFHKGLLDLKSLEPNKIYEDSFKISGHSNMGNLKGNYRVVRDGDEVKISFIPNGGWTPKARTFFTKMMLNKHSVFCQWPKSYIYKQTINLNTGHSNAKWENKKQ